MGAHSKIEWTDHTWNPWIGCTKVAAGCAHCYAESFAKRYGKAVWGPGGTRVKTSDDYWKRPLKWNAEAKAGICPDCRGKRVLKREVNDWGSVDAGTPLKRTVIDPCQRCGETGRVAPYRARVFCASLADLFEDWGGFLTNHHGYELFSCPSCGLIGDDMQLGDGHWEKGSYSGWEPGCNFSSWILRCRRCDAESPMSRSTLDDGRRELFRLIDATPNIDWLLLTKRPENVPAMISCGCDTDGDGDCARPNVWLGTSIACQADADRNIPLLLRCRELSPVLFLSCEPLVGPVDLTKIEAPLELQVSSSGGLGANCLRDDDERFYQLDHHVDW
ncbi:MAG TPA: DUF5131 family protein, partial [Pirellulales bacterium]|nr:DUF5131 family protein [Pirellulales bacterium]